MVKHAKTRAKTFLGSDRKTQILFRFSQKIFLPRIIEEIVRGAASVSGYQERMRALFPNRSAWRPQNDPKRAYEIHTSFHTAKD